MQNKYIIFSDGKSPHTLKWISELSSYFELYLISLNGYSQDILEYIPKERVIVLNEGVNVSGGNFKLLMKYFDLLKVVKEINPKYFNAHYLSSYGFLGALIKRELPNIKLIVSTWGTDILLTPFENRVKLLVARYALKVANLITSDSYFMSDKISDIYKNDKTITFPFGLRDFEVENIVKDEHLIFSNRALSANYNIDKVIEWFATTDNNYKLVIANSGELLSTLKKQVASLQIEKRVEFVGFLTQREQTNYYKNAKYYISIPSSDSTSVSLLEAMRYGCYPIISNLPANREWIINGFNGKFFTSHLNLPLGDEHSGVINQQIIKNNAIFSKSIQEYTDQLERI